MQEDFLNVMRAIAGCRTRLTEKNISSLDKFYH